MSRIRVGIRAGTFTGFTVLLLKTAFAFFLAMLVVVMFVGVFSAAFMILTVLVALVPLAAKELSDAMVITHTDLIEFTTAFLDDGYHGRVGNVVRRVSKREGIALFAVKAVRFNVERHRGAAADVERPRVFQQAVAVAGSAAGLTFLNHLADVVTGVGVEVVAVG